MRAPREEYIDPPSFLPITHPITHGTKDRRSWKLPSALHDLVWQRELCFPVGESIGWGLADLLPGKDTAG